MTPILLYKTVPKKPSLGVHGVIPYSVLERTSRIIRTTRNYKPDTRPNFYELRYRYYTVQNITSRYVKPLIIIVKVKTYNKKTHELCYEDIRLETSGMKYRVSSHDEDIRLESSDMKYRVRKELLQ